MSRYNFRNSRNHSEQISPNMSLNGVHIKTEIVNGHSVSDTESEANFPLLINGLSETLFLSSDAATTAAATTDTEPIDLNTIYNMMLSLNAKVDTIMNVLNISTATTHSPNPSSQSNVPSDQSAPQPIVTIIDKLSANVSNETCADVDEPSQITFDYEKSGNAEIKTLTEFQLPLAKLSVFRRFEKALAYNENNIRELLLIFFGQFAASPKQKQIRCILLQLLGDTLMIDCTYVSKKIRREFVNLKLGDEPYKICFSRTNFNTLLKQYMCSDSFSNREYDSCTSCFISRAKNRLQNKHMRKKIVAEQKNQSK